MLSRYSYNLRTISIGLTDRQTCTADSQLIKFSAYKMTATYFATPFTFSIPMRKTRNVFTRGTFPLRRDGLCVKL